jgi:hypothetical protein
VGWFGFSPPVSRTGPSSIGRVTACPNNPSPESLTVAAENGRQLCCVNPTLNSHPETAASFLEARHLAENNNTFAVRTVSDRELRRNPPRINRPWCFRIDPAIKVTTVALKIIPGLHACHSSPRRVTLTSLGFVGAVSATSTELTAPSVSCYCFSMKHQIRWNPDLEEWFCIKCGLTSDRPLRENAQAEIEKLTCDIPAVDD